MALAEVEVLIAIGLALSVSMTLAWVAQQRTGNSGWVDTIWTFAVGLVGAIAAIWPQDGGQPTRQWLVAALVLLWSARLGTHLALRSFGGGDDPRYASYAQQWGRAAPRRMFVFLQSQAWGALPLAFSVFVAAHAPRPDLSIQDYVGAAIALAAIAGEAIADGQLRGFKASAANAGRVCDVGLWGWSRHPNYFFEWLGWTAYPVIAVSSAYASGWASVAAPAVMYWALVHVTGVPPLEAQMLRSRGDRYRA